jgi:type I restriction enzyme S subunit
MTDRNANRPGYKQTKVGWIPEEWDARRLDSTSTVIMGQSPNSEFYNEQGQGLPLIQGMSDISDGKTQPRYWTTQITKECQPDDIILSVRAPVGSVARSIHHGCIGRGVCAIRSKKSSDFTFQLLQYMEPVWARYSQGSTFEAVVSKDVKQFPVPTPPLSEQKKIAEILSTWDRAIEQTQKLIDAKQRLKKGLMQHLLTGRMRFPGFGAPAEKAGELPEGWEERKLAEVAKVIISGVDKKTKKDEIPVFLCNYMDVFQNQYITSDCNFMVASATKAEIEKYKLQKNDVLLTKDSETREDIANSAIMLENIPDLICGYHLAILRPKDQFVDGLFLAYIINFGTFHNYFVTRANGVTRFGVTIESIKGLMVRIPNLVEQKKIAFSLLNLDNEQKLLIQRVNLLKKQKGGLMQKLLNGEVRAKV